MSKIYSSRSQQYAVHGIEQNVATIMAGCLAAALAYLQSQSIIHPDVKPGNVPIRREPMAAILGSLVISAQPDGCKG